jgi:hypothetical protein
VLNVEAISERLIAESIGYRYCLSTRKIVTGASDWEYKDTLELDERLVDAIFEFYQNERNGWSAPVGEQETQKEVTQIQLLPASTGDRSIGESKHTESMTPVLAVGSHI